MSLVKVINSKIVLIFILIIIAVFFRSYQLNDRYIFDWDQEDDALKVTEMITSHKPRLIGPRVANESGFFVGPFHYYFLTPFYFALNGNPYAGAYATIFVAVLTTIAIYFVVSKIFSSKIAFLSAIFYAASSNVISWNVIYTPLLSVIIFYLCYQLLNGKKNILPLLIFIYSFSFNTHLVPATLIIPILVSIIISRAKPNLKQILLSVFLFIIPFIPLIIFDIRHNFINILSLRNFILSPKQSFETIHFLFLRSFWRSLNYIFLTNPTLIIITRIFIILVSIYEIYKTKNSKFRIFLLSWILAPLLILSMYRGNIPEYYYGTTIIILPILVSIFFNRIKFRFINSIVVFLFLIAQFQYFYTKTSAITLKNKLNLTKYLVNQNQDKIFNLSYDLPAGVNSGFGYLFKYLGREPQNIPQGHLYSVFLTNNPPKSGQIVYSDNILGLVRK